MVSRTTLPLKAIPVQQMEALQRLVWGHNISEEIFLRWSQGMHFSEYEPCALIQQSGGPCAVIAPVQGFIIKNILFSGPDSAKDTIDLKSISGADAKNYLKRALCDILELISDRGDICFVLFPVESSSDLPSTHSDNATQCKRRKFFGCENFHSKLMYARCHHKDAEAEMVQYIDYVLDDFGVLAFLYSALLTKGLDTVQKVLDEIGEPIIDPTHGHGSQCLVNMLLTGEFTPHVFDGVQDAGGMKLTGISRQAQIGFLSLLESHRLLEVGWNFKTPVYPIWVIGSETHLTVLFSQDASIVRDDKQTSALRILNSYDAEGNGFIDALILSQVMRDLQLLAEPPEYVEIMREKLDSENLGIILINNIMEEFFPQNPESTTFKEFDLQHYNGIKRSNDSNKIEFHKAKAIIHDFMEQRASCLDSSQILKCLVTKWPTIEIVWLNDRAPSLN